MFNEAVLEQNLIAESVNHGARDPLGKKIGFFGNLFGCWHKDLGRPFTSGRTSYRACLECGARKKFDTQSFETSGPFFYPPSVASERF
jgi:hypothetical protein